MNDSYHWRTLLASFPSGMGQLTGFLRQFPLQVFQGLRTYFVNLPKEPGLRYQTVVVSCAVLFVSVCILSASNPFRLLWPGAVFPLPETETRSYVSQFGLSRTGGKLILFKRAMLKEGSIERQALHSLQLISQPLHFRDVPPGSSYLEIEPLPGFSHAVRRIWFRKEKGLLILDLRLESLEDELDAFFLNAPISDERRTRIATAWFEAATASLLLLSDDIQKVAFRLDGKHKTWKQIRFDLRRIYTGRP